MRFFAFGCSFTRWAFPTWADYLAVGLNSKEYYNYAKEGASNQYILYMLGEALENQKITENDYVAVMFTTHARYSFYKPDSGWITNGDVLNGYPRGDECHPLYQEKYKYLDEHFWSPEFGLQQSWHSAFIVKKLLETLNIKHTLLQGPANSEIFYNRITDQQLALMYENKFNAIVNYPENLELFQAQHKNNVRISWKGGSENDGHPTTEIHFDYFKRKFPQYNNDTVNRYYQEIVDNMTLETQRETSQICNSIQRKYVPKVEWMSS